MERVLVGFSGGVDSCVAALLLRTRGHAVTAAMMSVRGADGKGCGSDGDAGEAAALAGRLGIPFRVFDCSGAFRALVLDYFRNEYLSGRTPNPCVRCNPLVKFAALPAAARAAGLDFDLFATGHYARVRDDGAGPVLMRGVDCGKDQSYFLYRLGSEQLSGVRFPLGGLTKAEVRRMAEEWGVPVHDKPDSQDFNGGAYGDLLDTGPREGEIVDGQGDVLGTHSGFWNFTVGQRKGLGVAWKEALYVTSLDAASNRVVVGTRSEQMRPGCVISDLVFNRGLPEAGRRFLGRLRSSQALRGMRVESVVGDGALRIVFDEPVQGVAPGQSLVLYDGDDVVGGGVIDGGTIG